MKTTLALLGALLLLQACSHPIEIVGEGDILSESGDRDCLLEQHAAGLDNCSRNLVVNDYVETYFAVPRTGWRFHRWANYCVDGDSNECGFNIPSSAVQKYWGETVPPLTAIFRPTENTGFNALLIGHSFFDPYVLQLPSHAARAGFADHTQSRFFSGGGSGTPQAFWENASKRAAIQAVLDTGDIELFGMTYHPDYPSIEGYRNWVDYALQKNPDTRFFIAVPWLTTPASFDAPTYESIWHLYHPAVAHGFIDTLRQEYPGVDFYCIPYGQSAVELRKLYAAGNLPEVDALVSNTVDAIYRDTLGHPDDILVALGELVWLRAIYGVDLLTYDYDTGYTTDLKAIATAIMDEHDPNYNAP
ncbi:MAG: hypothetical protein R3E64_02375 [Halioglobus sp.]